MNLSRGKNADLSAQNNKQINWIHEAVVWQQNKT